MRHWMGLALVALIAAAPAFADEAPKPDVNKVLEDMAAIGPDALLARVKELRATEQQLKNQAAELRKQADQKDAEAAALRKRIETVEKFTADLVAATKPPEPKPAPEAKPAAQPAPAKPEPQPAPAPAEQPAPQPEAKDGNSMGNPQMGQGQD